MIVVLVKMSMQSKTAAILKDTNMLIRKQSQLHQGIRCRSYSLRRAELFAMTLCINGNQRSSPSGSESSHHMSAQAFTSMKRIAYIQSDISPVWAFFDAAKIYDVVIRSDFKRLL